MNKNTIISVLAERGYKPRNAALVADDLMHLSSPLDVALRRWLDTEEIVDFSAEGYSVAQFMQQWGMKYPAALLTMDWILKEPEIAIQELKKGIK
ncbi:MAG: hypothetical protein NC250_09415 [Alistipes senegalensis]|nr:hypothetical protein [Bacteroides cellulosilyticus]MCM1352933.1 hypothetical protein [Alistipes senegalensis]